MWLELVNVIAPATGKPLRVAVQPGEPLARAVWLGEGVAPQPLCSGLGRCGRCRVRFVQDAPPPLPSEESLLSADELAQGWRLACRRHVPADALPEAQWQLELPAAAMLPHEAVARQTVPVIPASSEAQADCVLACDLGTTSLCWQAVQEGKTVASGTMLNPQAGAGADVVSRLAMARTPEGLKRLAGLVRGALAAIVGQLHGQGHRVCRICLAANTAMTGIFLERDIGGLCAAPYRLPLAGDETVRLDGLPPIYIPPQPAPFVGGDVSAGLLALARRDLPRPLLLADLGTNAELALLTADGGLVLASAPLGPALEGIGPECGQMAAPDVVTRFGMGPGGLVAHSPDGLQGRARGISATGYVSLLAVLLRLGLLAGNGTFVTDPGPAAMPLTRRLASCLERRHGRLRLSLPRGVWLSASDVEELLKVKAAFAQALHALLAHAGPGADGLGVLCLAGAIAEHVDVADLETLGFLPRSCAPRVRCVGNTALEGAGLLANDPALGGPLAQMCARATVLPLAGHADYQRQYLAQMRFGA